jgi:hypothetical protein
MSDRSTAEVEQEIQDYAMEVVALQKDVFELEQQRDGPEPPADLEDQIRLRSDDLKKAQARWAASKAEAESAG